MKKLFLISGLLILAFLISGCDMNIPFDPLGGRTPVDPWTKDGTGADITGNITVGGTATFADLPTFNDATASTTLLTQIMKFYRSHTDATTGADDGIGGYIDFMAEDESGSATTTNRIGFVLDDTATTSIESSFIVYQKLDNAYTLTDVFQIDSGDAIFYTSGTLTANTVNVGTFTQGGGVRATSTTNAAETLLYTDFDTENWIDYTPNVDSTLTLPASSTLSTLASSAGNVRTIYIRNASTTPASALTLAAGTGLNFATSTAGVLTVNGLDVVKLDFVRMVNTDFVILISEYIDN